VIFEEELAVKLGVEFLLFYSSFRKLYILERNSVYLKHIRNCEGMPNT